MLRIILRNPVQFTVLLQLFYKITNRQQFKSISVEIMANDTLFCHIMQFIKSTNATPALVRPDSSSLAFYGHNDTLLD